MNAPEPLPAPVPQPAPPPPPKKRRRWGRWTLGALALLVAAAAAAVPLLGPGIAADAIRNYVASHYTGAAATGPITVSWSGRIVVDDLRLTPTGGPELVRIRRVVLDVNLGAYLAGRGDYVLSIERPEATVRRGPDGRTNLEHFLVPPAPLPDSPLKPTRLKLDVTDGRVDYDGTVVDLPSARFETDDLNRPGPLRVQLAMPPGVAGLLEGTLAVAAADLVDPAGDLTLALGRSLRANLKAASRRTVSFDASADMTELGEILRAPLKLREGVTLAGGLTAGGTLQRSPLLLTATIAASDLAAVDASGRRTVLEPKATLDLEARAAGDAVELTRLALVSSALRADGKAQVKGPEVRQADFDASFDLNLLNQKLATFMDAAALKLGGTVAAKVRTEGNALTLTARGERVQAAGLPKPLDFDLSGTARVTGGATQLEKLSLTSAPLALTAGGTWGAQGLAFEWDATAEPAKLGAYLDQPLAGPPLRLHGTLTGPIDAPVLQATSTVAGLAYGERALPVTSLEAALGLLDRSVRALRAETDGLRLDARGTLAALDADVTFDVTKAAAALGSTFTGGPGDGKLRLELGGAAPRLTGTLKAKALQQLGDASADFDLSYGTAVEIRRLEVRSAAGTMSAEG
jgi:hypothetical protein